MIEANYVWSNKIFHRETTHVEYVKTVASRNWNDNGVEKNSNYGIRKRVHL